MAIEFVEPKETKEPEKVRRVMVKAEVSESGNVVIRAYNEDGTKIDRGNLFDINRNGRLYRRYSVNPDLGFDLDGLGRIKGGE